MKNLRKFWMVGVMVGVSFSMTSCFFGEINNSSKEIAEVTKGNVFLIPAATLEYSDGIIFSFAESGKKQRIQNGTTVTLYLDNTYYVLDTEEKKGTKYTYEGEFMYNSSYCFFEATLKLAKYGSQVAISSETIAGKKCTIYTQSDDNSKMGGWSRILFLIDDVRATSFTPSAEAGLFLVPTDYVITDLSNSAN